MSKSAAPIRLELRASPGYQCGLALVLGLALIALALADLPLWLAMTLGLAAVISAVAGWRKHRRLHGTSLRLHADGVVHWRALGAAGEPAQLRQHVCLGPLIALELRLENGQGRRVAVWRDMTDHDTWRRLRVDLAHRRGAISYTD